MYTDNVRSMLRSWLPTGFGSSAIVFTSAGVGFTLWGVLSTRRGGDCFAGSGRDCTIGGGGGLEVVWIALRRVVATVAAAGCWREGALIGVVVVVVVVSARCVCGRRFGGADRATRLLKVWFISDQLRFSISS